MRRRRAHEVAHVGTMLELLGIGSVPWAVEKCESAPGNYRSAPNPPWADLPMAQLTATSPDPIVPVLGCITRRSS